MDALYKAIVEALALRGQQERDRREEWNRSLKPTQYLGKNLFQEMGGQPIEGRYLGKRSLIPGQFVPNIGRNPNKPVVPGLPNPVQETIEEEVPASFYLVEPSFVRIDSTFDVKEENSFYDLNFIFAFSRVRKKEDLIGRNLSSFSQKKGHFYIKTATKTPCDTRKNGIVIFTPSGVTVGSIVITTSGIGVDGSFTNEERLSIPDNNDNRSFYIQDQYNTTSPENHITVIATDGKTVNGFESFVIEDSLTYYFELSEDGDWIVTSSTVKYSDLVQVVSGWSSASNGSVIYCDTSVTDYFIECPSLGSFSVIDVGGSLRTTGFAINNVTVVPFLDEQTIEGQSSFVLDEGATSYYFELVGLDWKVKKRYLSVFDRLRSTSGWGEIKNPSSGTVVQESIRTGTSSITFDRFFADIDCSVVYNTLGNVPTASATASIELSYLGDVSKSVFSFNGGQSASNAELVDIINSSSSNYDIYPFSFSIRTGFSTRTFETSSSLSGSLPFRIDGGLNIDIDVTSAMLEYAGSPGAGNTTLSYSILTPFISNKRVFSNGYIAYSNDGLKCAVWIMLTEGEQNYSTDEYRYSVGILIVNGKYRKVKIFARKKYFNITDTDPSISSLLVYPAEEFFDNLEYSVGDRTLNDALDSLTFLRTAEQIDPVDFFPNDFFDSNILPFLGL